ncbi:hemin ABC transporter substrate-binding protein [Agreia sp. COWG]|uniref:heme/hemin ABC transporter substrate-binding protein n=1 Tax=Agreia sp. COWG TaxID=2773266 RepID=UPI001AF72ECF|nr:ABC transporter substrate-binding protein [Agreia sp. COWG]CAD6006578.1 Heme ABC transporter, cell surface heme and hemoprotein receptor HmuT [Agreia sp. COWG]
MPLRPSFVLLATLVVASLSLTSCASPSAPPPASQAAGCDGATAPVPLDELVPVDDPRTWDGPSTACLASDTVVVPSERPSPQLPVTVTDNQGSEVTITDASRILALDMSGTLAATVFSLGLGDNVVGRDTSTGFAQALDLPVVTQGGHQLSAEAILALAPTVVITDSSIGPWNVILQLRDSGIPVVVVTPERSIDNVDDIVSTVAAALGVPEAGDAVNATLDIRLAKTHAEIAAIAPADDADKLRVLFLYVRGSAGVYYIFGEESGADDLITGLGAVDVAAEIGLKGMRPLTAEALVQAAPDAILVMTKGLESVGGVDGLIHAVPAVAETPAGAHRRIVDMSDYDILSFGPRTPDVLEALARALYAPSPAQPAS